MKRYLAALAIGGAVFGTVLASAASLGTITDGKLGSSSTDVDSCQTNITANYVVSWDTASDRYEATGVRVNDVNAACKGKRIGITLVDVDGNKLAENATTDHLDNTATPPLSQTFDLTPAADNPAAAAVEGVRVVIYGD